MVVYPVGSGRLGRRLLTWNAGGCCGYAAAQSVDDVGFTLALLRDVARNVTGTLLAWGSCPAGAEVQLWRLTGAGHGWPGGHVRLPEKIMGPETVVIDAAFEVWRFVSRFRRPDAPALEAQ